MLKITWAYVFILFFLLFLTLIWVNSMNSQVEGSCMIQSALVYASSDQYIVYEGKVALKILYKIF